MTDLQKLMNDINLWANNTFERNRTATAPLNHLKKEVVELIEAINEYHKDVSPFMQNAVRAEFADCFILILNAASKHGLTANDLIKESKLKMIINKSRKWGNPDKNGVVEHIR